MQPRFIFKKSEKPILYLLRDLGKIEKPDRATFKNLKISLNWEKLGITA